MSTAWTHVKVATNGTHIDCVTQYTRRNGLIACRINSKYGPAFWVLPERVTAKETK